MAKLWHRDNCLFSQSCGYPLMHEYQKHLQAIAIPDYNTGDNEPGLYRSVFIINEDSPYQRLAELRGGVAAVNGWDSQSGFNCLRHSLLPLDDGAPFFSKTVISGGHRNSIKLVTEGACDIAAIDQVTFTLIRRCCPAELSGIRIIEKSAAAPCLPFVTSIHSSLDLKAGLLRALAFVFDLTELADVRRALLLKGFFPAEPESYFCIREMAQTNRNFDFTKT